jgi:hypothetical protein
MSSRARKHPRPFSYSTSIYRDRVPDEDDFEVVHTREATLDYRSRISFSERSIQKGFTPWKADVLWNLTAVEDDQQLGLSSEPQEWEDVDNEMIIEEAILKTKKALVCFFSFFFSPSSRLFASVGTA